MTLTSVLRREGFIRSRVSNRFLSAPTCGDSTSYTGSRAGGRVGYKDSALRGSRWADNPWDSREAVVFVSVFMAMTSGVMGQGALLSTSAHRQDNAVSSASSDVYASDVLVPRSVVCTREPAPAVF